MSPRPGSDIASHEKLKASYRDQDFGYIPAGELDVNAAPPVRMDGIYIPRNTDGSVVPLRTDDRNIVVHPLAEAEGRAHTALGSKVSDRTGDVYRQTATFMQGNDIPWGRVDWSNHGLPVDHPQVHLHPLKPILNKFGGVVDWQQAPIVPFRGH